MYIIIKSVFNLIYYEHLLHSYWGNIPWHIQKSECLLQFVFNFPTSQTPIPPPPFLQPNYFQINIHFIFKCLFTIVAPAVLINAIEKKLLELLKHFTCSSHIIWFFIYLCNVNCMIHLLTFSMVLSN